VKTLRYAAACGLVVALGAGAAAALLDGRDALGVLAAGALAFPIQVVAFAVLARYPLGTTAFMAAWVGGTLVRMVAVGLGGWALVVLPDLPPVPTLLGLAAFFFVMLLLEPRFLGPGHR
jgi:hypothetical protein